MNTLDKITALKAGDTGPALAGTKYERADYVLDGGSACSRSPNKPMRRLKEDAQKLAAENAVQRDVIAELVEALMDAHAVIEACTELPTSKYDEALDLAKQLEDL